MDAVKRRRGPPPYPSPRPRPDRVRLTPPFGTPAASRDHAAALLELARANYHLSLALDRTRRTKVGGSSPSLDAIVRRAKGDLAVASVMRKAPGPILGRAIADIVHLEAMGRVTAAQSNQAVETLVRHHQFTKVGAMPRKTATNTRLLSSCLEQLNRQGGQFRYPSVGASSDLPPELAAYSDGVSDDGAFHPEIIGCGAGCNPPVAGLGDLTVAGGLPWYAMTASNLRSPVARARFAAALRRLTPKVRRRVLNRLKAVVAQSRVSGAVRSATPTVGWGQVAGIRAGQVSVGRCPYANVAGALTP